MNNLLRATAELIAERGIEKLTVTSVAARAGLSRRLIYLYFRSLTGLLEAYVQGYFNQMDAVLADQIKTMAEPTQSAQRMHLYLLTYARQWQTDEA
ncbi:helix-turn-helix domain-containing protein [Spirosoma telluris]